MGEVLFLKLKNADERSSLYDQVSKGFESAEQQTNKTFALLRTHTFALREMSYFIQGGLTTDRARHPRRK